MSQTVINSEIEEWRPAVGIEWAFEVSSFGRIRSVSRKVQTRGGKLKNWTGRDIGTNKKGGYFRVTVPKARGGTRHELVHRLVAIAFVPNPESLPVVNHIDGNKANNRPHNLEWCTQSYNCSHAHKIGLAKGMPLKKGDESIASKLTEEKVRAIKRALSEGARSIDLARHYGVVKGTIGEIKAGRSWGHVS